MSEMSSGTAGTRKQATFCRFCEALCGLVAEVEEGKVARISPDKDNVHSRGHACIKGVNAHQFSNDPDRIRHPMKRVGGPGEFERVSWDEALADIANRLRDIQQRHGQVACASYRGNPIAFNSIYDIAAPSLLGKLGVGTRYSANSLDINARVAASYMIYGTAARIPLPHFPKTDFLLVVGANPLVSNGSAVCCGSIREEFDGIAERGRVVVIDPRRTETAQRYEHVGIRPGTDAYLLAAMIRQVAEDGLADEEFIAEHCSSWGELRAAIEPFTPDYAAAHSGVPAEDIVKLARDFARSKGVLYSRVGIGRAQHASTSIFLGDALNIVCGRFGKEGGWVFGNSPLNDFALPPLYEREDTQFGEVAKIFGETPVSLMADQMLTSGESQVRALINISGNLLISGPGGERLTEGLETLELFVALDLYINETNAYADYVLPTTSFLERMDIPHYTLPYMPRPVLQFTDAVVEPQGECRNEVDILAELGARVAGENDPVARGEEVRLRHLDKIEKAYANYGWPSIDELRSNPQGIDLGDLEIREWKSRMSTPDRKLHLWHELLVDEFAKLLAQSPDGELRLFGRRDIRSMNSWTHNIDRLVRSQKPALLIHPDDAEMRGIDDGAMVRIDGPGGSVEAPVEYCADVIAGSVCYPHGWGHKGKWARANATDGVNINLVLPRGIEGCDPVSGVSYLEGFPVTVSALQAA